MKILIVGAGAIGGYFGGRLLEAGRDVTFLVRPRRAEQLRASGLRVRSPKGDLHIPSPPTVLAEQLSRPFDLILLSCKAYDLESAIESFTPAVGPNSAILPLLNGMRHLDVLEGRFGADAVLGGHCLISTALDAEGHIQHLNDTHVLTFGERSGARTARVSAIYAELAAGRFDTVLSDAILAEMWEKWIFIATLAGMSCLMRASLGDIVTAGGGDLSLALRDECVEIAKAAGFAPRDTAVQRITAAITHAGSTLSASMLRDIERGARTEGEHILGDLLRRAPSNTRPLSMLRLAYIHVKAYEARMAREAAAAR
ncbi:MAG TPA: 2-dehydropantoate 2-reductase [Steroidobacteraceae bacterium]|jgi:2-dehydropantoate 2-reductase|nr:2-dehydropantoate 2-reductase [Steroidobacteraceae bacterium]